MSATAQTNATATAPSPSDQSILDAREAALSAAGSVLAIAKGELPTNTQILNTLDSSAQAIEQRRQEANLNDHGDQLAVDAERVLQMSHLFISEKNKDEVFQDLFYQSKGARKEAKAQAQMVKDDLKNQVLSDVEELEEKVDDIFYVAKRVIYEIIRSKHFRRLLLDVVDVCRSIFFRKVQRTSETVSKLTNDGQALKAAVQEDLAKEEKNMNSTLATANAVGQSIQQQALEASILTPEELNEIYGRLQKILQAIQANPDYQLAVNGIFQLIDQMKDQVKDLHINPKIQEDVQHTVSIRGYKIWTDIKVIIERFAGENSFDQLWSDVMTFYHTVANDQRARSIFEDGRLLTQRTFANPKLVQDEAFKKQFTALFEKSNSLTNDPIHNELFNKILNESTAILQRIRDDPLTNDLSIAIRKFGSDLVTDHNGRVSIGAIQDSLLQLKSILVPVIAKQLEHIPVARIDGDTPKWEFAVEGVVFSAYDVMPDYLKLYFQTQLNLDLKQASTDTAKAYLRLELNHIRAHLKNVHFAYRRKVFPTIEDDGWADVDLGGKGLSIRMDFVVASNEREQTRISVADVDATIDSLDITVKKAQNHGVLDRMAVSLFSGTIKREIEDELQVQLRYFGRYMAEQLNEAFLAVAKPLSG